MKNLALLSLTCLIFIACSTETPNQETENVSADLSMMTPNPDLDTAPQGMYVGVFGHNTNRSLHGKVYINAGNNGNYKAQIKLVNGETMSFKSKNNSQPSDEGILFTGKRGSFILDISNPEDALGKEVYIDKESESYLVLRKATSTGGVPTFALGTYEETGNELNFYGNWDLELAPAPLNGVNFGEPVTPIVRVILSHTMNAAPFEDATMEQFTHPCTGPNTTPNASIAAADYYAAGQTSVFGSATFNWGFLYRTGGYLDVDNTSNCVSASSGVWTNGPRSGIILLD